LILLKCAEFRVYGLGWFRVQGLGFRF